MTADAFFTRREGDQLTRRLEAIDSQGTRGMQLLTQQTQDNTKAIGRLQQEVHERFAEHTRQHDQEAARRKAGRRWLVTAWLSGITTAAAVIGLLLAILGHLPPR